jgi:hypothetical protein
LPSLFLYDILEVLVGGGGHVPPLLSSLIKTSGGPAGAKYRKTSK